LTVADSVELVQRVPYQEVLEGFGDVKTVQAIRIAEMWRWPCATV